MNKAQKAVEQAKLDAEKDVLLKLKKAYQQAADDCAKKIKLQTGKIDVLLKDWDNLDDTQKSVLQSQIYQRKYQILLKSQIDGFLTEMNQSQHDTVDDYLKTCYEDGYVGSMYDLHSQKVPIISPIDQKQAVKAVTLNSKVSKKLYGSYVTELKKRIQSEISRGVSTGLSYGEMARNLNMQANIGFNKAMRIARTEGHGVQVQAANAAQHAAKKAGADIVKQWDAALDARTRDSHRMVDGEIRELDEKFSNGMMYPSDPAGGAAEVINCRCALLQRARWALAEAELETLKERAAYYGLDKTQDFEEFKQKYLSAGGGTAVKDAAGFEQRIVDYYKNNKTADRDILAREILDNLGLSQVPVNITQMSDWGYCSIDVNGGIWKTLSYNLRKNDTRKKGYRIKTAFHEAFHAKADGLKTDFYIMGKDFLQIEETFAESAAHYMAAQVGIKGLSPSYPEKLLEMLPRLKQLPEYKNCKTISDFGKIALEQRINNGTAEWAQLYNQCMSVKHDWQQYAMKYFHEIEAEKEKYIDKVLENMPQYKKYKMNFMYDLGKGIDKIRNGQAMTSNETLVVQAVVSTAMSLIGVK